MLPFVLGAIFGWLLVYLLYPFLNQRLLYHPISRSSHIRSTPCGGGISFVLVSFICSFIAFLGGELLCCCFAFALLPFGCSWFV